MDERSIGARYRLAERLGSGGMASVWRALDTRTGRIVAVKRLHPHLRGDKVARERLQREAATMTSLDHPNVVAVIGVVDDDGSPAIVMEHLAGVTVADRLADDGRLPESVALGIAIDIAEALAAAHARGLIHRDVKPGNILLTPDGRARLMDFGIAADASIDDPDLTAEGVIGTLRYLAPERLLGEPAVPATDVWGLGVVLYEMLAGVPAYPGTTLPDRINAAGRAVEQPPGVSTATWAVIERAADGDPARRYPDGASLASALRSSLAASGDGVVDGDASTVVVPVVFPSSAGAVAASPVAVPSAIDHRGRRVAAVVGAIVLAGTLGLAVIATDPGRVGSARSSTPAGVPADAAPVTTAVPSQPASDAPTAAPAVVADDGDGKSRGKGNGKGKGKDKP